MTLNIEKARIMLFTSLGLTVASVGATIKILSFVSGERDAQATRMAALRDEMAELGDALSIQASQMASLREHLTLQLEFIGREQTRLREDLLLQESATAATLRDLRTDIKEAQEAANGK